MTVSRANNVAVTCHAITGMLRHIAALIQVWLYFSTFIPSPVARTTTPTFTTMSGILSSPTLNVPHLSIETSPSTAELRVRMGRARSSSLLKVETVGQNGQEEDLDQNLYENVNAEWVNRKGQLSFVATRSLSSFDLACVINRCMAHSPSPHLCRQNRHRHNSWNETGSELDTSKLAISWGTSPPSGHPNTSPMLAHYRFRSSLT